MKIKLKALKIPKTTGELLKQVDPDNSVTTYQEVGDGTDITEMYYYETTGHIQGTDVIGTRYTAFVPKRVMNGVVIERTDHLVINSVEYEIIDLKNQIDSHFEDHYELGLMYKNQP